MFERNGGYDVLKYDDVPEPKAGPNDVVIKVKASACNFNDIWARRGLPGMKIILPHISGSDAAGVVVEAGSEVKTVKVGDEVVVHCGISCRACSRITLLDQLNSGISGRKFLNNPAGCIRGAIIDDDHFYLWIGLRKH